MLNIFETYDQAAQDLHYSLVMSGFLHPTVILNENGFLPDSVTTPYAFFMGEEQAIDRPARYFNQIKVPDFWEIKSSNANGEVFNHDIKKANIYYAEPTHERKVRAVEWLDRDGKVRLIEFYNKRGRRYAQSVVNKDQEEVIKTYYDQKGHEKIVENFVTNDIILNDNGQVKIFKSKLEWMLYYLQQSTFKLDTIIYNSLALPFQISVHLKEAGQDILVWQEPFRGSIPGNMQAILNGTVSRSQKVIIPNPENYRTFLHFNRGNEHARVLPTGYHYPIGKGKIWSRNALILTNSDQLEQIDHIVDASPNIDFHIGALTEMSTKLQTLGQKENVFLYPNMSQETAKQLWKKCSVYLDINHGNEILFASRKAFEEQMPILAFRNVMHQKEYVLPENCFNPNHYKSMVHLLATFDDPNRFKETVQKQLNYANHATIEEFKGAIEQ